MDLVEAEAGAFEAGARHPWELARLTIARDLITRHVALAPGHTVLDVGCGDIFVVNSLAEHYPSARFLAVDSAFTPAVMATLSARARANVSLADALDRLPVAAPPALILLMDVIEHVPDDRAFLRDVLERTRASAATRLLITVPSYPALMSDHDVFLGHYRRYTRATMRALLQDCGLAVVEDGHFFTSLAAARAIQVLKNRVRPPKTQTGVGRWEGGDSLGRIIAAILTLDARTGVALHRLGLRVPGLSNFAVCRRLP
jgi:SAM-dependent methyltransferase